MSRKRKILLSLMIVGAVGAIAGVGSYSAFTATTASGGNVISSGTVVISDDDSVQALYTGSNLKPGDNVVRCINVSYTGSLDADMKLYTASSIGALGPYITLKIEYGSGGGYGGCTGFSAAGTIFNNTLANFGTNRNSWANGLSVTPNAVDTYWAGGGSVNATFKFTVTLQDDNLAQGLTTGSHAFTWEARNR